MLGIALKPLVVDVDEPRRGLARKLAALAVLSGLSFAGASASAQPAVTSVSGSMTSGGSITVSGSSFGTNNAASEWLGPAIEAGSSGSNFSAPNWSMSQYGWSPVRYSTDAAHSGSKSLKVSVDTANSWNGEYTYHLPVSVGSGGTLYLTWWVKKDGSNGGQWKMLRISQNDTVVDGPGELVLFNWLSATAQIVVDPGTSNDQTYWPGNQYFPAGDNTWYRMEATFKPSSNGNFTLTRYGSGVNSVTVNTSTTATFNHLVFQNYMGNGITGSPSVWTDDIYVQNSAARVELCNASTWNSRNHCEIQPKTAWSGSSVVATANPGSFGAGQTAYLYVVDDSGRVNANGLAIVVGGSGSGGAPPRPGSPTSLRIVQ